MGKHENDSNFRPFNGAQKRTHTNTDELNKQFTFSNTLMAHTHSLTISHDSRSSSRNSSKIQFEFISVEAKIFISIFAEHEIAAIWILRVVVYVVVAVVVRCRRWTNWRERSISSSSKIKIMFVVVCTCVIVVCIGLSQQKLLFNGHATNKLHMRWHRLTG